MNYRVVGTSSEHSSTAFDDQTYLEHHQIKGAKWGVMHGPPYPLDDNAAVQAARKAASKARAGANMAKGKAKKAIKSVVQTGEGWKKAGKAVVTSFKAGHKARKAERNVGEVADQIGREMASKETSAIVKKYDDDLETKGRLSKLIADLEADGADEYDINEEVKTFEENLEKEIGEKRESDATAKAAEEKSKSDEAAYKNNVLKTGNIEEVFAHPEKFSDEEIGATILRYQKITEIGNLLTASKPKEEAPAPQQNRQPAQQKSDLELGRTKDVDDFIKDIVNKGDVNAAVKNADKMTKAELDATIAKRESIDKAQNTAGVKIANTLNALEKKSDNVEDTLKNVTGIIRNGIDLYNVVAKLYNQSDKKTGADWKIIDLSKKK